MPDAFTSLKAAVADRYSLERELGRGGMATVYLAQDLKHDRPVALKALHPELGQRLGAERFLREIKLAARLQHPHILPVHDSGEAGGLLWYTMPYVEGESLRDRLQREVQLPLKDAVGIAREVADALSYAHSHGVVHRDIKPENILLTAGHALVADFGIAKALEAAGGDRLTETGIALGTPTYMSPEQSAGEARLDGRSDIYSLGSVLYEMLAGEPPFSGPTAQAVVAKRLSSPPPPLRTTRDTVPPMIEQVVTRALSRAPADRHQTAAEFMAALEGPATTAPRPAVRRPAWLRFLVIGLALAGLALLVAALWRRFTVGRAPITSLAVLPLATAGGDSSAEYLSEGLTETLINNLARLPQLQVTPRSTVFWYRERNLSALELGRELSVGAVLTWNMRRHGGDLLIQTELLRVADGSRLWGDQYDRPFTDVLTVQEEIARTITDRLQLELSGEQLVRLSPRPSQNAEAYELYTKGRYFFLNGQRSSREVFEKSRVYFEQAIAKDSTFALAWSGLADYYGAGANQGFLPLDAFVKGDTLARKALSLDPDLAEAHNSLGAVLFVYQGDWIGAEREFRKAIALNPRYSSAHRLYGDLLRRSRRTDDALRVLRDAVTLEPYLHLIHVRLGEALLQSSDTDAAIQEFRRAQELEPNSSLAQDRLAQAYAAKQMYPEAAAVRVAAWRARGEAEPAAHVEQAYKLKGGMLGYREVEQREARRQLALLKERGKRDGVEAEAFVRVYARAGDWNRALESLERAVRDHPGRLRWLLTETELDSLRSLPAARSLWKRAGLPEG